MTIQRGAPRCTMLQSKRAHCTAHHSHCRPFSPVPKATTSQGSSNIRSPEKAKCKAVASAATAAHHHSQMHLQHKQSRPSMLHGRPGPARLITKYAMCKLVQSLNNNGAIPVGDERANIASAGLSSPVLDPSNLHIEEAGLGNVTKGSLRLASDKVRMVTIPATLTSNQTEPMWTAPQQLEPNGCVAELRKSPTKRPLSPESVHEEHSAIHKRRQLPAIYAKLTVTGPPSPLQPQELAHFSTWETTWNQCSISSASGYTFKALPGAANMLPGAIAPAQLLAVSPRQHAPGLITPGKQHCSVTSSPADHVAITILTSSAVCLKASPAGQEVVKLALVLDGETVRAVITPLAQPPQPLRKQALAPGDLSDPHSASQLIPPTHAVISSIHKQPPSSSSISSTLSNALAFRASIKMVGSMAFVHLELLDDLLNGPASAAHAASTTSSTSAPQVDEDFATSIGSGRSSSTNTSSAATNQAVPGLPTSLTHRNAFSCEKGRKTTCRGGTSVGCDGSSTTDCPPTLCATSKNIESTAHLMLELQGEEEQTFTQGQSLSNSPPVAKRPTALQLPATLTSSLFGANCGSSSSDLSNAAVKGALQESACAASMTLQSRAAAKHSAPSSWLARVVHGVVSSLFAPCLGMQPTAVECNANHHRRSLHGMRSTSGGRADGDVWVSIVKAGNKAGSGVGKLVRKLSSMRSRKDVDVAVDRQ